MAVIQGPGAGDDAVDIIEGVDLLDLRRVDDFHPETDVVGYTFHVMEPVQIDLLASDTNATRRVPAHVLTGFFFQGGVQAVAVVVDFRQVVVAHQAGALSRGVPGRAGCQLAFFNEHNVGFAFLGQVVGQRHTHDAAPDNDDFGLGIHSRRSPLFFAETTLNPRSERSTSGTFF